MLGAASNLLRDVVIAPAAAIDRDRLARLADKGAYSVLYLGTSYSHYAALRNQLPAGWLMRVPGPTLNAAAERLRDFVVNLDSYAWPKDRDRAAWDATRLGERGPLASPLMLNLARLAMFADAIKEAGPHLVIGDDIAQCRLWMREAKRRGRAVTWLGSAMQTLNGMTRMLRLARQRLAIVKRFAARKWHLTNVRRRHALPLVALRTANVLVTIWGRANTFSHEPLERENNLGRLPVLLRKAGYRVAYLVYPLYTLPFRDVVANALQAGEPVVFVEDLISWRAILSCVFAGLGFPAQIVGASTQGLDVADVLRVEAEREAVSGSEAVLLRDVGAHLSVLGIEPDLLMHLYEGQPWEKMLARGIRDHLPLTKIVGVQHAPFAHDYLSFFPSRRSLNEGATVDLLLTAGDGYARWLREAGMPDHTIGVVGAVRYADAGGAVPTHENAVLCATGIDLDEAIELASKAAIATQGLTRRLIINYHPVTDDAFRTALREHVMQAIGDASDHVTFSTASIRDLLAEVSIVLYATSAACFEAVKAGRAAIYVGRDLQLDYDKLPEQIAMRCRSVEELRDLLRKPDLSAHSAQSPDGLDEWLGPVVDPASLAAMLSRSSSTTHPQQSVTRGAA